MLDTNFLYFTFQKRGRGTDYKIILFDDTHYDLCDCHNQFHALASEIFTLKSYGTYLYIHELESLYNIIKHLYNTYTYISSTQRKLGFLGVRNVIYISHELFPRQFVCNWLQILLSRVWKST